MALTRSLVRKTCWENAWLEVLKQTRGSNTTTTTTTRQTNQVEPWQAHFGHPQLTRQSGHNIVCVHLEADWTALVNGPQCNPNYCSHLLTGSPTDNPHAGAKASCYLINSFLLAQRTSSADPLSLYDTAAGAISKVGLWPCAWTRCKCLWGDGGGGRSHSHIIKSIRQSESAQMES